MLTQQEKQAVVESWRLVVPIKEATADHFFRRLFELQPDYRKLFPDDMLSLKEKFLTMLSFVVKSLDWAEADWDADVDPEDDLALVVLALGRRHTSLYKIPDDSYEPVGEALIWSFDQGLGGAFTDDARGAWTHLYRILANTMRLGGRTAKGEMELGRVA